MRRGLVQPNSVTYLSALSACSGSRRVIQGKQIHALLWKLGIESELRIETKLMDMYSKCGSVEDAWKIFESVQETNAVSITVMLAGLAKNGSEEEAIHFFISMYSKRGDLDDSLSVFRRMSERNYVSWSSMIASFARHGHGLAALKLYEEMIRQDVNPTDVTFLSLLHACSHVKLINEGQELLKTMQDVHGIEPSTVHYACIVDMLGRAGRLQEAKSFIESLPKKPDCLVWNALIGACSFYGDTQIGRYAAEQLFLSSPDSSASHILMANIYSSRGQWKEKEKTIKRMKAMGVSKGAGVSWIEIENQIHRFSVNDKLHLQAEAIHDVLSELFVVMLDKGYRTDKSCIYLL